MQIATTATGPVSRSHGAEFYSIQTNALKTSQIAQLIENKRRRLNLLDTNRQFYSIQMDHRAFCRLAQLRVEAPGCVQFNPELQCYNRLSPLTSYRSQITDHAISNRHNARLETAKKPTKTRFSTVLIVTFLRLFEQKARASRLCGISFLFRVVLGRRGAGSFSGLFLWFSGFLSARSSNPLPERAWRAGLP